MSSHSSPERNRMTVPVLGFAVLVVIAAVIFLVARGGGDGEPSATPTTSATPDVSQAANSELEGSGDAPEAIAVSQGAAARTAAVLVVSADVPKLDLDEVKSVTVVVGQDDGATMWYLTREKDSRGAFIAADLVREKGGASEEFACNAAKMVVSKTRFTVQMPLSCLDEPDKPLKALFELTDTSGTKETTSASELLEAPKK